MKWHPLLYIYLFEFNIPYIMFPEQGPIGIFDSGYGGLTIFEKIAEALPAYDYI